MAQLLKLSDFIDSLDLDAVYEGLGLAPINRLGDEDQFHCLDFDGLHAHGDTTGKFFINREKKVGQCWVCGGCSLVQLASRIKDISYDEALEWLRQFADGGDSAETQFLAKLERLFVTPEVKQDVMPYYHADILEQWEGDHPFFQERGISEEVRKRFRCGYDSEKDAIVFPHFWEEKLVGWQRRNLSSQPKYQFSKDFPRSQTLWGYQAVPETAIPIIVESVPSALKLISADYSAIATFGSNINDEQITYLRRFSEGVILAPDNDSPGQKWLDALFKGLSPYIPVYRVGIVEGEGADIGDLASKDIDDHIRETLELVFSSELSIKI